jgi:hypothetical protein
MTMRTEAFIDLLAKGAGPAPAAVAARRLWPVTVLGVLVTSGLALSVFGPLPAPAYGAPALWVKLAYTTALAGTAGWLTARLSRPVARLAWPTLALLSVLAAMALLGAMSIWAAPSGERLNWLFGRTWWSCPWNVLAFSLPVLAGTLGAVRGLAPIRARAAGFAAGLLAGAIGALGYALACPEVSPAFVAIWYSLGITMTGMLGAVLGPRVLRW